MAESTGAWLTQDAFDRLTEELEHLSAHTARKLLTASRRHAMRVTLRENGGYHAARDEQAKNEAHQSSSSSVCWKLHTSAIPLTTAW